MVEHLYLHIPFCHHICPYCAFYKHKPGDLANRAFVKAIVAEAEIRASQHPIRPKTIYLGGGTPSLLSRGLLRELFDGLSGAFDLSAVQEWTIEANPATFGPEKAALLADSGITRVSLGVQSFQPGTLATLGRDHSGEDAIEAFHLLVDAGIPVVSVDLMFSIPGQQPEDWSADLDTAIGLAPQHISCYNLTYEEDTDFMQRHTAGELDACEDRDAGLFYAAMDRLEQVGYQHYEISNFARPGYESAHNSAYWQGADYLGLGPSAVSTVDGRRWKTLPDTAAYVTALQSGGDGIETEPEELTSEDKRLESIALQLRTSRGIPMALIEPTNIVESLVEQGLLRVKNQRLFLTREGKALADPIAAALA